MSQLVERKTEMSLSTGRTYWSEAQMAHTDFSFKWHADVSRGVLMFPVISNLSLSCPCLVAAGWEPVFGLFHRHVTME